MATLTAEEVSRRLFTLNLHFLGPDFASKVKWIRDNFNSSTRTREELIHVFVEAARDYMHIACDNNFDSFLLEGLARIADPACVYVLFNIVTDAVHYFEKQGTKVSYEVPEDDADFFEEFSFYLFP